jgi:hypothetical protein
MKEFLAISAMLIVVFLVGADIKERSKVHAQSGGQAVVVPPIKVDDPVIYFSDGSSYQSLHYACPDNTVAVMPYIQAGSADSDYVNLGFLEGYIISGSDRIRIYANGWPKQPICIAGGVQ